MQLKECTGKRGCGRMLPLDSFHKKKGGKYDRNAICKECKVKYDHVRHANDSERLTQLANKRQKENPARTNAIQSKRRALKKNNPIPEGWVPVDEGEIKKIFAKSVELGARQYPVDHIIPVIKGGPHHQWNLRVISRKENSSKGCKMDEELYDVPYCYYREERYTLKKG